MTTRGPSSSPRAILARVARFSVYPHISRIPVTPFARNSGGKISS